VDGRSSPTARRGLLLLAGASAIVLIAVWLTTGLAQEHEAEQGITGEPGPGAAGSPIDLSALPTQIPYDPDDGVQEIPRLYPDEPATVEDLKARANAEAAATATATTREQGQP
jgi:hypothetical protein